jgi:misacylated tRNA(Ala) deacylase
LTELLYQKDSYLREFEAIVIDVDSNNVVLDRTAFHPLTGGVDCDLGYIRFKQNNHKVLQVLEDKTANKVLHTIEGIPSFDSGEQVQCTLDWQRRYTMMKLHTASHILASILFTKYGALITGGHIDAVHAKDDFSLESSEKTVFEDAFRETNFIIDKGAEVKVYFLSREEALRIPDAIKLAHRTPPDLQILRIVEISGVDIQADGGPHVKNTNEIGELVLERVENKGRGRKRVYYKLGT